MVFEGYLSRIFIPNQNSTLLPITTGVLDMYSGSSIILDGQKYGYCHILMTCSYGPIGSHMSQALQDTRLFSPQANPSLVPQRYKRCVGPQCKMRRQLEYSWNIVGTVGTKCSLSNYQILPTDLKILPCTGPLKQFWVSQMHQLPGQHEV